ncbi:MAG: hypothetical protein WC873_00415 [Candidatus Gracilibacteria bacterium]
MKKILLSVLLACLALSNVAVAADFRGGDTLTLSNAFGDDLYAAAGNVVIENDVSGDVYVAGGSIMIKGNISGDLVVVGGQVQVLGNVADDVRVAGGNLSLSGIIGDDLLVFGGQIAVSESAEIKGDLIMGAGYVSLDGSVLGGVSGGAGAFLFGGNVAGDMTVTIEDRFDVKENAKIGGNLNYSAVLESKIPDGVVAGKVEFNKFERDMSTKEVTTAYYTFRLISYFAILLIALLAIIFMPNATAHIAKTTRENVWKACWVGLVTLIVGFVGSLILLPTLVGAPVAIILLISLFIVMYLAKIYVAFWLAGYMLDHLPKKKYFKVELFFATALGLLAYYLVGMIPYVGWLLNLVLFLIGVGSAVLTEKEYYLYLRRKKVL